MNGAFLLPFFFWNLDIFLCMIFILLPIVDPRQYNVFTVTTNGESDELEFF